MRALIAEDCQATRALLESTLLRRGHLPTMVRDGQSLLLAQEREAFPLLFVDRSLPAVEGPELFRRIRLLPGSEGFMAFAITDQALHCLRSLPEGDVRENEVRVRTSTDSEGRALVEVRDTGRGYSPDVVGSLFVRRDTALPLTICHGIVISLGGTITVVSTIGAGSVYRIVLPPAR